MDHVLMFPSTFKYVNPPKYEQDAQDWGFGLKETSEVKINEFLDRYDFIQHRYKSNVALIHKEYDHLEDFTSEFFLSFESYDATESIYLKKWLKYWKRIYEAITETKLIEVEEKDAFDDDDIERAREVKIEDLYEGDLKTLYDKSVGICPFHKENTGSFTIYHETNSYNCFGACKKGGDSIDFYMNKYKVNFIEAVKGLLNE